MSIFRYKDLVRVIDRFPGTHSQIDGEFSASNERIPGPARLVDTFEKASGTDKTAEEIRRQRRLKRRNAAKEDTAAATPTNDGIPDAAAASLNAEKKSTKKERKMADSKFSEQQQHKSANEAARMAFSGLLGNRKKAGRTFDWMNAGKGGGASPAITPGGLPASTTTSTVGTPAPERVRIAPKEKSFGQWEENKNANIEARDVLLVLESDGRASRSFLKGLSLPEKSAS